MSDKLSKQKREQVIISYLKGTPDPHFIVTETKSGRYIVKIRPIEIEEEDINDEPDDEPDVEPEPEAIHESPPRPKNGTSASSSCGAKQNARQLLVQLAAMLPEDDEPPQRAQRGWNRRKLRF